MWVVNLLGQSGVTVNGSSIRASRLDAGDELKIGDILVRVILDEKREATNGEIRSLAGDRKGEGLFTAPSLFTSRELATRRSKAVWMTANPEAGKLLAERVTAGGELSESLLALVLDQFGQMQQQFLNQFQQTALIMFRALGTMHRDQMNELQEKLDSLHQLGENLKAFQAQMSATVAPDASRPMPEGLAPAPEDLPSAGLLEADDIAARVDCETHAVAEDDTESLQAKLRSTTDQPNIPSSNVHEWLIGRLAAIEDEQRSRWQRILDMLRGRSDYGR